MRGTDGANVVRLALVGCGEHGSGTLLPGLMSVPRCRVMATCDADDRKARAAADLYGIGPAYAAPDVLLDEVPLDAVVLAGPPAMHYDVARLAIARGVHVFVEKPPAETGAQVRELADLAERHAVVAMVGQNLRYTTGWLTAMEILADPAVGDVVALEVSYLAAGPRGPRWSLPPLRSFLLTHGIHAFDLAVAMFGRALEVRHSTVEVRDGGIVLMAHLLFAGGKSAVLTVGTAASGLQFDAKLITDHSHVVRVDGARHAVHFRPGDHAGQARRFSRFFGGRTLESGHSSAGYGAELEAFLAAVRRRARPVPSLRDAQAAYGILESVDGPTAAEACADASRAEAGTA